MAIIGATDRYRIKQATRVDFSKLDADDRSLFEKTKSDSFKEMEKLKDELHQLQKTLYAEQKHRILVVIQAMDTGGKDGCIRHVFSHFDPHGLHVTSFKKPNEDELARDFLWRVHKNVPANGHIAVFNRSHYEDIIAVRVKDLYPSNVWRRRYQHVIDFEKMLAEEGTTIVKIFLHISKEEQLARLQARLENPLKHWKFHPDDLSDREKWGEFMSVYADLIGKTSTNQSPWYVVPSNKKWYRNLVVAKIMVDTLKKLKMKFPEITWDPSQVKLE